MHLDLYLDGLIFLVQCSQPLCLSGSHVCALTNFRTTHGLHAYALETCRKRSSFGALQP
jgi:hypothetical protein